MKTLGLDGPVWRHLAHPSFLPDGPFGCGAQRGRGMAEADKNYSPETPPSEWLTYLAASERLGLSPSTVATRARRRGWPIRVSMGETEVEVPGASLAARKVAVDAASGMHERVASAVGRIDRL